MEKSKSLIWSLPTRIFHWLFVIGVVSAYFLAEEETLNFHISFGFMVGILILFRIIWGIIGPKYSKFSDFPISQIPKFLKASKEEKSNYAGHNPIASFVMILLLIVGLGVVVTGILNLSAEYSGIFSISIGEQNAEFFEELHETFVNLLIGLVILHLMGIVLDYFSEKEGSALGSIFTGFKQKKGENVHLNLVQKIFSFFWIFLSISVFIFIIYKSEILLSKNNEANELEHQEFEELSD